MNVGHWPANSWPLGSWPAHWPGVPTGEIWTKAAPNADIWTDVSHPPYLSDGAITDPTMDGAITQPVEDGALYTWTIWEELEKGSSPWTKIL